MDPLSQGVLGASAPMSVARRKDLATVLVLGLLSGMSADLDVLIQSPSDPLLFLEYHRQFTHSLVFIPFGGLICALVLHRFYARHRDLSFRSTYIYCTLGYATHALLDACTTYGTQLLWPFSNERVAFNTMPIVDPLYTLPILVLILVSRRKQSLIYARIAIVWILAYPCLGLLQRDRAQVLGHRIAAERGHQPQRLEAKPSFGNIIIWKIIYETADRYHVDAVRVAFDERIYPGDSVVKLDVERDFPWLDPATQQARDVERFRWFSGGYLALDPLGRNRVVDMRYSLIPNQIDALWGIELDPAAGPDQHVNFVSTRDMTEQRASMFRSMLMGD